jgi:hypothetical protein
MEARSLWLVVLMIAGCVAEPRSEAEPAVDQEEPAGSLYPGYAGPEPPGAPSPCVHHIVGYGGHILAVPVPCDPFYRDTGDPPPEHGAAHAHDPVAR